MKRFVELAVGTRLTPESVEQRIREAFPAADHARVGVDKTQIAGVRCDLSLVEFAEISALAELALLVEAAVRNGVPVTVALPFEEQTPGERAQPEATGESAEGVLRRQRARTYMANVGFIEAVQVRHLTAVASPVRVLDGYLPPEFDGIVPRADGNAPPDSEPVARHTTRSFVTRSVFPLRWMLRGEAGALDAVYAAVNESLGDLGLTRREARALAAIVRRFADEMVEWPPGGGAASHFLVGAVVLDKVASLPAFGVRDFVRRLIAGGHSPEASLVRLLCGCSEAVYGDSSLDEVRDRAAEEPPRAIRDARRLAQSYDGAVAVRSGTGFVAGTYVEGREPAVDSDESGWFPATLLELDLLRGGGLVGFEATVSGDRRGTDLDFHWVQCEGDQATGFSASDTTMLLHEPGDRSVSRCIIATCEAVETEDDALRFIERALTMDFGPMAIVVPPVLWRSLKAAMAMWPENAPTAGRALHQPVLVIDSRGEAMWCGGDRDLRRILTDLFKMPEGIYRGDLRVTTQVDGSAAGYETSELLTLSGDRVVPRFTPLDVIDALSNAIGEKLRGAIAQPDGTTVREGPFRIPTLAVVKRWIDVPALLAAEIGVPVGAFALARKLDSHLEDTPRDKPVVVVRVPPTPAELAAELSDRLGGLPIYSLPSELDVPQLPQGVRLPTGARVILCTDVIVSENTLDRAVADVQAAGADPWVAACVIDARRNPRPIDASPHPVPVMSLVQVDYIVQENEATQDEVRNIDPLLRLPTDESPPAEGSPYELEPERFLELCETKFGVLCLGHIQRAVAGHSSVYLNLPLLLRPDFPQSKAILEVVVSTCRRWITHEPGTLPNGDKPDPPRQVAIWFPGSFDEFSGQLASAVRDQLGAERATVHSIPRASAGGHWSYPRPSPAADGSEVLIVDWRSIEGSTIPQMIRLAAGSGATSVRAVVLLSQLSPDEELALTQISSVRPLGAGHQGEAESRSAPLPDGESAPSVRTGVAFVSGLDLGSFDPHNCPICTDRQRYLAARSNAPTQLLRDHAKTSSEWLEPREREEVFRDDLRDLFRVAINPAHITMFIRLRKRLHRALSSTQERQQLLVELTATTDPTSTTALGWIRLLAAERQWLSQPPLSFSRGRELVGRLAVSVASSSVVDVGIRLQALTVLNAAAPQAFLDQLGSLLETCAQPELVSQLLFEFYDRLVNSSPHLPPISDEVINRLRGVRDEIRADVRRLEPPYWLDASETLDALIRMAEYLSVRIIEHTPLNGWRMLGERYGAALRFRSDVVGLMIDALREASELEAPPEGTRRALWTSIIDEWKPQELFLAHNVLPLLPDVREIILDHFGELLGPEDFRRIANLCGRDAPFELARIGALLRALVKEALEGAPSLILRNACVRELQWWYSMFLDPGSETATPPRPNATLLRILEQCPCELDVLMMTKDSLLQAGRRFAFDGSGLRDESVFCDRELLRAIMRAVIMMAVGPSGEDRDEPVPRLRVHTDLALGAGEVQVRIVCDQPMSGEDERMLTAWNQRLRVFNGRLNTRALDGKPWRGEVILRLRQWR
ncbi:MAG: hypothetical protein ACRD12_03535 [Acidimicrobiales bacterium]